jgi:hypothetical protein
MLSDKRHPYVLAVLCLGSLAGAVHAEEAFRTSAVAAFPDLKATKARTTNQAPAEITEGTDLNRLFAERRSARSAAARADNLLENPYGTAANEAVSTLRADRDIDGDERWSNPYATARLDERWDNPYSSARLDERWDNPYGGAQKKLDEHWANPYGGTAAR